MLDVTGRTEATVITAGIDLGSVTVKVALMRDGELLAADLAAAGFRGDEVAAELLSGCLVQAEISREAVERIVATGYGRARVGLADRRVTEITCHARGARHLLPDCRLVIDIGGQDSKAIALAEDGRVLDFAMNDKCAAGTGRFLEVMANALEVELTEFARQALAADEPAAISSICTVFAESEVVGQVNAGTPRDSIAAGICASVAARVAGMASRLPQAEPVLFTGGVSRNAGVVEALQRRLDKPIVVHEQSQLAGAIGAALIAGD